MSATLEGLPLTAQGPRRRAQGGRSPFGAEVSEKGGGLVWQSTDVGSQTAGVAAGTDECGEGLAASEAHTRSHD